MKRVIVPLFMLLMLLALCATMACAQEEEVKEYFSGFTSAFHILMIVVWSVAYIGLYAAAAITTMSYLQVFNGFDAGLFGWLGVLWAGGIAINFGAYAIMPYHWLAVLLALLCIFGWSMLVGTRDWVGLTVQNAIRVSIAVALICAPYAGPWTLK